MKPVLIATWLLLSSLSLHAQTPDEVTLPVDTETKRVTYTGVVAVQGASQNELYTRAKLWLFLTFGDAKDALKVDEKEAGLLVVRVYTDLPIQLTQFSSQPVNQELGYTLMLNFKDGRYKYTLTNYDLLNGGTTSSLEKEIIVQVGKPKNKGAFIAKQYTKSIIALARLVTESIDTTLQKPVSGNEEW